MWPALNPDGHRVPRTKTTCLLHTWRPHRQRPFALVLHLYQHQSSHNLHLQYLAKSQSTQCCQSLITPGSDHPSVLEPHMVLTRSNARPINPLLFPCMRPRAQLSVVVTIDAAVVNLPLRLLSGLPKHLSSFPNPHSSSHSHTWPSSAPLCAGNRVAAVAPPMSRRRPSPGFPPAKALTRIDHV
jgi:hypothetical protein